MSKLLRRGLFWPLLIFIILAGLVWAALQVAPAGEWVKFFLKQKESGIVEQVQEYVQQPPQPDGLQILADQLKVAGDGGFVAVGEIPVSATLKAVKPIPDTWNPFVKAAVEKALELAGKSEPYLVVQAPFRVPVGISLSSLRRGHLAWQDGQQQILVVRLPVNQPQTYRGIVSAGSPLYLEKWSLLGVGVDGWFSDFEEQAFAQLVWGVYMDLGYSLEEAQSLYIAPEGWQDVVSGPVESNLSVVLASPETKKMTADALAANLICPISGANQVWVFYQKDLEETSVVVCR